MKVAIYARVSTNEERQDLMTQLLPLRDYCKTFSHDVYKEYTDTAKSRDFRRRVGWDELISDAMKHHFKAVVIFKLDRAFRSVKHMHDTLEVLQLPGVELISIKEQFDTRTAMGRLMMNITASFAEFELDVDRERIISGLDRARRIGTRSGKAIGRPKLTPSELQKTILTSVMSGETSIKEASRQTGISRRYISRWIRGQKGGYHEPI